MERDLFPKDQALLYKMIKASGIRDIPGQKDDIKRAPISDDDKEMLLQRLEHVQRANTKNEE